MENHLLSVVVFAPLVGAVVNWLVGRRVRSEAFVGVVACGAVAVSAVCAFLVAFSEGSGAALLHEPARPVLSHLWTWMQVGDFRADFGFAMDRLSGIYACFITFVGLLIHVFATGYMRGDKGFYRFFAYLNLFMFMMLTLVLADNLLLMFVGWEGVGLCSYLLIGYYTDRREAGDAAKKAFVANRVGDWGVVLGIMLVFTLTGSISFFDKSPAVLGETGAGVASALKLIGQMPTDAFTWGAIFAGGLTSAAVLLFIGATGKSAQIPLYVWLPDAMAGPTPVSALIHAATMVTAGVYMVVRCSAIYSKSPTAMLIMAVVGALTALFAATIGITQFDIKKVLAYSTVSQLGYMFLAMGVGAYAAGIFHLVTHAFFKACLFLGSGSVIHAMHHEQDMRRMGGLRRYMPITFWTFFISTLAIAGLPPLAGFFSKDEILWKAFLSNPILWGIGACAAFMTAFYMFRQVFMTFFGEIRADHHTVEHLHESSAPMTMPLVILAFGAITVGWLGIPHALGGNNLFEHWLEPVFAASHIDAHGKGGAHATAAGAHGDAHAKSGAHGQAGTHAEAAPDSHGKGGTHGDPAHGEVSHGEGVVGGEHHDLTTEYLLMGVSIGLASLGILLAYLMYSANRLNPDSFARIGGGLPYRLSYNKYYVDEVYNALFVRGAIRLSRGLAWFDAKVVDGIVNLTATITHAASAFNGAFDKYVVDGLVNFTANTFDRAGGALRLVQTGSINAYLYVILIGVTLTLLANAW